MVDYSNTVLDLDNLSNIGHPCWEFFDPNPDIQQIFNRFNNLFFDGVLRNRVILEWGTVSNKCAGGTWLPQSLGGKIFIVLNESLLRKRLRKEIIEQLLHEMIHAYLIEISEEDEGEHGSLDENNRQVMLGNHGPNFFMKLDVINKAAKLNITVTHDLPTRLNHLAVDDIDKRYMWRCRGICRNREPYFGFIWVKENRAPNCVSNNNQSMWTDGCEHEFERSVDCEHPNQWLTERKCVTIFNKFVTANRIQIRTNAHYVNYDDETGTFINVKELFPNLYSDVNEANCTVCTICFHAVAKEIVIEHLYSCSGLTFSLYEPTLPILMINESNQN